MKNISDKTIFKIIMGLSIFVFLTIIILNKKILPVPEVIPDFVFKLPMLNAFINGTCSILLLLSLYMIKQKNILLHKKLNLITFALSSLFLVSYITYHWMGQETKFPSDNPLKYTYYFILISHIILAAIVLPLVLYAFYHGLQNNVEKHKKITRWAWPIWFYVTVTGVVIYLMISPYYTH